MAYSNDSPIGSIVPYAGYYFASVNAFEQAREAHPELTDLDFNLGISNALELAESGWLLCDGKQYLLALDPLQPLYKLCRVLSLAWGGNLYPSGHTFRVPNLQGLFLRGVSFTSIHDPEASARTKLYPNDVYGQTGNQVGSYQKDQLIAHKHGISGSRRPYLSLHVTDSAAAVEWGGSETDSFGGLETRPRNVYVHYLIKAAHQPLNLMELMTEVQDA